jgi:GNAT superfamily N-acetyltransferase
MEGDAPLLAAPLLAEAFAADPLMRHAFAPAEPAPASLAALFAPPLAACAAGGAVRVEGAGAAAWLPAGGLSPLAAVAAGFWRLPLRLPLRVLWRLARHERGCARALAPLAQPGAAAYLWLFGVRPGARGQGVGRALLDAACAAMSGRFARCLLKTENPGSAAFYARCGFRPRGTLTPPSGLSVWLFERQLRA